MNPTLSSSPGQDLPPTPFFSDVMAQARVLNAALHRYAGPDAETLELVRNLAGDRWPAFVGMGSSLYAPYPAVLWLNGMGRWAAALDASELLHYAEDSLPSEALPVLVSQSGESAELVRLVEKWQGRPFVAITNNTESTLANSAALVLPLHAGEESATSSRTFVNTVAVALLLAGAMLNRGNTMMEELRTAADGLQTTLDEGMANAGRLYELLGFPEFLDVAGRGPGLAAASQSALILREAAGVLGASHSVGLLRHGPLHDIQKGRKVLLFASRGKTEELGRSFVRELLDRGADVALVTSDANFREESHLRVFMVPQVPEYTFPIPAIVGAELLGCYWAASRGMVPGERVEKVTRTE